MMLQKNQTAALDEAERRIRNDDFGPYLRLKSLVEDPTPEARKDFRLLFTDYYGLKYGGLTNQFKDKFFELLHGDTVAPTVDLDFSALFRPFASIMDRQGRQTLQLSFISKLVAIRREGSPIYDKHVEAFFQAKRPPVSAGCERRILWFERFLTTVKQSYELWANDERVAEVLERFRARDERLAECHPVRLMDLLVWKVGNKKLLSREE